MIVTAFITILGSVIRGIALILPSGTLLPTNFSDMIGDVIQYTWGWDWIIPVGSLLAVFGAGVVFLLAEFAWRGGRYLIALFRGN